MFLRFAFLSMLLVLMFGGVLRPVGLVATAMASERDEEEQGQDGEDADASEESEPLRKGAEEEAKLPTRAVSHQLLATIVVAELTLPAVPATPTTCRIPPDVHQAPLRLQR